MITAAALAACGPTSVTPGPEPTSPPSDPQAQPPPCLTITTGELPHGCSGGHYTIDGEVRGEYPVECASAPAGRHVVGITSDGDCAGMGDCELAFAPARETVYDVRIGCETAAADSPCPERLGRGFLADLGHGPEPLKAIRNPHWNSNTALADYGNPCSALGEWRVAAASYSAQFAEVLRRSGNRELIAVLDRCPVSYRHVDTTCPPCPEGTDTDCTCTSRDVSDWIFCTPRR